MTTITLIQPRHNYAPPREESTLGHVYMPTSLMTAGARLLHADVEVQFFDENVNPVPFLDSHYVGINLLGTPYIPEVINLQHRFAQEADKSLHFLLGGQVVSGLTPVQFQRLFGDQAYNAHNGNDDTILTRVLKIDPRSLPHSEQTSLVPMYEKLSDREMELYLTREFSLYVSQGCKFVCDFCAAVRTREDPFTGETIRVNETYRNPAVLEQDLAYLAGRAKRLNISTLQIYMSNLDVFQTPDRVLAFAKIVKKVRNDSGILIELRGLSAVSSFFDARKDCPASITELVEAGFHTVGFGVDGMTANVWQAIRKGHNTEEKCLEVIRSAREDFGLTPEILMVFGHEGKTKDGKPKDTPETLRLAYEFMRDMGERYDAVPRPHVAKSFVPGNDGWFALENTNRIARLLDDPETFQCLDFTAIPTEFTHSDPTLRNATIDYYTQSCMLPGSTTSLVFPITPDMSTSSLTQIMIRNRGKYDR